MKQLTKPALYGSIIAFLVSAIMLYIPVGTDVKGENLKQVNGVTIPVSVGGWHENYKYGFPFTTKTVSHNDSSAIANGPGIHTYNYVSLVLDFLLFWILSSLIVAVVPKRQGSQPDKNNSVKPSN